MNSIKFELETEYIELVKLVKLYSKGMSGGEIKMLIDQGEIQKNGNIEYRKRAKLVKGDIISFFDNEIEII
jgi:ribosome-associated protein